MNYKITMRRTVTQTCEAVVTAGSLEEANKIAESAAYCMTNGVAIHANDVPVKWRDEATTAIAKTVAPVEVAPCPKL